jgi:hypothetical protein
MAMAIIDTKTYTDDRSIVYRSKKTGTYLIYPPFKKNDSSIIKLSISTTKFAQFKTVSGTAMY